MDTFESKVQWGSKCMPVQQEKNEKNLLAFTFPFALGATT